MLVDLVLAEQREQTGRGIKNDELTMALKDSSTREKKASTKSASMKRSSTPAAAGKIYKQDFRRGWEVSVVR